MTAKEEYSVTRRRLLRNVLYGAGGVAGLALLFGMQAKQSGAHAGAVMLPPPGALEGELFAASCIRCGQCIQACPYGTLRPATQSTGLPPGLPYFVARSTPCEMCEDIPCVVACPSGALSPDMTDIYQARMGLAVLLDHETCIAWQGLRCEICYNACPAKGTAITLKTQRNERTGVHSQWIPTVSSAHCTGCGKCEQVCILDEAAIKVLPIALARGKLGAHYRLGWEEKEAAGHALVPETPLMEVRKPEGEK